ncbi:hypothetical protein Bca52824_064167 [Brassica carinata]|uniref:THO complex subunitTHOC2 C-terminal domain-containing protein n=1 Tax=Brassica carinata TaxID=52824 RepID=A0A8X7U8E0_BRACI|nr:hypothetical protein Bca52824_064167 [Brassica carinata]
MSLPLLECKYVTDEFVREGKNGNYCSKLLNSVPMLRFLYELCWILVRGELPIQSCKAVLEKTLVKSSSRLRDSLLPNDEPKLAIPLLLLISQHRSLVVVNADAPYIKMVTEQFDRCHGILLQYVDFLSSAVSPATVYAQLVPSLEELVHTYHLEPEVAFLVFRHVMRFFKCRRNGDVSWPLDSGESVDALSDISKSESSMTRDVDTSEEAVTWFDVLDTVRTMLPSKAWNSLSPDLYAIFWGLTLYDLHVPRNRYESEISKQHAALKTLEEVADNSSLAITKRKKEKERIQESLDRLTDELKRHEEHVASVRRRLSREKDKWLSSCPDTLKINMEFLQRCIFPRCTFSMADSVYSAIQPIDVLICKTLQPMICCCTEYEVGRLGRFLFETLKIAYHWKSAESVYERECDNMPGFAVYYRFPDSQRVTFGQFVKVHWKWCAKITKLLIQCLESNEYMEICNALILLTQISGVFPVTRKTGYNIEKRVAKIKKNEREDLKVLATGVAAALSARKPSWVTDEEFGMGFLQRMAWLSNGSLATGSSKVEDDGAEASDTQKQSSRTAHSPKNEISTSLRSSDRLQKRATAIEDSDRISKRRKADETEARPSDRDRSAEARVDLNKTPIDDEGAHRDQDRSKDKSNERQDRGHRERVERFDKTRGDDVEKARDRSLERHGREHSVEKGLDRGTTRSYDRNKDERNKDDRSKLRHRETSLERSHAGDHFHSQGLPPPPNIVPQSMASKEPDGKGKSIPLKDDFETSKRRKTKRDQQVSSAEPGEYSPMPHQSMGMGPSSYEGRERKSSSSIQHGGYLGKESSSKMAHRDHEPMLYDREWEDEKRQRTERKRRDRK